MNRLDRLVAWGLGALCSAALSLAACGGNDEAGFASYGDAGVGSGGSTPPTRVAGSDGGYYSAADAAAVEPSSGDPAGTQGQPGTGVLTAGSIDDHLNPEVFDAFLEYAAPFAQQAPSLVERAQIRVQSPTGAPLGNAAVEVRAPGGELLLEARTGTDGRTLFVPSLDGEPAAGPFDVQASSGGVTAKGSFALDDPLWQLTIAVAPALPNKLDLAFVVDTTGSMGDELEFLKLETANIAGKVAAEYPGVDIRFGLIVYRDDRDVYVTRSFGFSDLATFQSDLSEQHAAGGGDYPEAMHLALAEATQKLAWREGNVARVAFLLADAPPHDAHVDATFAAFDTLRRSAVRLYPVASSGVADMAEYVMRAGAFLTLARYGFLTDDSGVGGSHAEPHVPQEKSVQPCYVIEKLEVLMIRMIASELAGKLLFPDPSNVLRTIGNPVDGVCQQEEQEQEMPI